MNITIISCLYPPETIGGAERHAAADAQYLEKMGHNVSVITTTTSSNTFSTEYNCKRGIDVYRFRPVNMYAPYEHQSEPFWKKPIQHVVDLWNPHPYWVVKQELENTDPDVVHIHNYGGLSKSVFRAADSTRAPVVHTLHDYRALHIRPSLFADGSILEPGPAMALYQRFNDWTIGNHVDKILSPSQFVIDKHHEYGVFTDVPCQRLPLGINANKREVDTKTERDESTCRLLYAGQHTRSKGIDLLIDAIHQIDDPRIDCHILGKGPAREHLETRAGDDDRITFHGFVSEEELERQYTLADYTVVPSRWYDNSPMVIYESFARGTPVLGANIGGIPELVREGETGYLFESDNSDSLTKVICNHCNDAASLIPTVENEDVSLDTHVKNLVGIYEYVSGF